MKTVAIGEFLSSAQIKKCIKLKKAKDICEQVIKPDIEQINKKLGQENEPMYLAFLIEHVLSVYSFLSERNK